MRNTVIEKKISLLWDVMPEYDYYYCLVFIIIIIITLTDLLLQKITPTLGCDTCYL